MLEEFNEAYDDAETVEHKPVPNGTYQVFVDGVEVKETRTGKPMIAWQFKVMSGTHEGRMIFKNAIISERALPYIKTDLSVCGLKLARFSDLPRDLFNLLNVQLEVKTVSKDRIKDNGEKVTDQNVYIQKKIGDPGTEVDDDDIPF